MKKIISAILLSSLLLISLTGCNTEAPEKGEVIDSENWMILDLIHYLQGLQVDREMVPPTLRLKLHLIKGDGYSTWHVGYTSSNYYFVCAYYNSEHESTEKHAYCCADKYTWLKFDNESEITEYYNDQKLFVAFQLNRPLFVNTAKKRVPNIEHFQRYEAEFKDGVNVKEAIVLEDTSYIFLTSSDRENIYHSKHMFDHEHSTIPCIYDDGQFYVRLDLPRQKDGSLDTEDISYDFGDHYDRIMCVIEAFGRETSVVHDNGVKSNYAEIPLDIFRNEVLGKSASITDSEKLLLDIRSKVGADVEIIKFTAETFTQDPALSALYSLGVEIKIKDIYLNYLLYDEVKYVSNPEIRYSDGLLSGADAATAEVLEKIKNSDSCYVLTRSNAHPQDSLCANLYVYDIDGVYYFLSFLNDNEVIRIHSAKL